MVRLKDRYMRLVITQGYKLSEDLFRDLLQDASEYDIDLNRHRIELLIRTLSRRRVYAKGKRAEKIQELMDYMKSLRKKEYFSIDFTYNTSDLLDKRIDPLIDFTSYWEVGIDVTLSNLVLLSNSGDEIVCFDFTRLLDWMAYEIGYATYDEELSVSYFDKVLGHQGMFYPCDMEVLDALVPENFEKELRELCLDTSVYSSYYVKTTKKYYNYFMQDMSKYDMEHKIQQKYISFNSILITQRHFLECIILSYLMTRANSSVIDFKLLTIEPGKIYFIIGENTFTKETFKENLSDPITITLLDRKFDFIPKVSFLKDEKR